MYPINEEQLSLYSSLFKGRTDFYARRWEKDGRSGYATVYEFDWEEFNRFRAGGGTFRDFKNKKPVPLAPDVLKKHLLGQHTIGIYPILPDNTSYFIAADFDGADWKKECLDYFERCRGVGLYSYLERSRSGAGGHVWLFFHDPFPCSKSRRMALELIRRALRFSEFDREVSFDRLFPNQDFIRDGGLGNLIALPLQGESLRSGNTAFLNPDDFTSYPDQWALLKSIHTHTLGELEAAYSVIFDSPSEPLFKDPVRGAIPIVLSNKLILSRSHLPLELVRFLKEKLNFISTEYLAKKRMGKSVYNIQKYFKLIDEEAGSVYLPRGFLNELLTFLKDKQIPYHLIDRRAHPPEVNYTSAISLLPAQPPAVEAAMRSDGGVIVAPSGSGKTIIGLEIVARRNLPALILVHRKQLLDQWIDRIQSFLGISRKIAGQYYSVRKRKGKEITVGMMQTFARIGDLSSLRDDFGVVIVDECHHIPAATFREVISQLNPTYIYGLTATPKRKHNDESLIYMFIGDIISEVKAPDEMPEGLLNPEPAVPRIIIRQSELEAPFKFTADSFQLLAKIICFDTTRNRLIVKDIMEQVHLGKKVLLLSERRDHLEILGLYLKGLCETIVISGEDSNAGRNIKLEQIQCGHYQVILSTGQFFGEGLDIATIDCLVLAFPFSFEGKLIQYIGRLRGRENRKTIIDYEDKRIPFLERQFKQRQRYYKKLTA